MKEKLSSVEFLIKLFKTFNILFIIVFCWVFADSMITVFGNVPGKATIYAILGGLYIGAYGAMTSQLWISSLEDKK